MFKIPYLDLQCIYLSKGAKIITWSILPNHLLFIKKLFLKLNGIPADRGRAKKKKIKVIPLKIGAWNVRTLMDSACSDSPQRRTALVGRELDRYKVEIAALSETCKGRAIKRSLATLSSVVDARKKSGVKQE